MKILFAENNEMTLYSFRKELLDTLILNGHDICLVGNFCEKTIAEYGKKTTIKIIKNNLRSINPFSNYVHRNKIRKAIREYQPEILLSFTIKPNIYCNLKKHAFFSIANITGLGAAFDKKGLVQRITVGLYKKSFKNVNHIMFQNEGGLKCFQQLDIPINDYSIIPGSGVNTTKFKIHGLDNHEGTSFLYPSRFIKQKGFFILLEAIPQILSNYPKTRFVFLGKSNKEADKKLKEIIKCFPNNIEVHTFIDSIEEQYRRCDFVVSPSFYNEGISNVLLEALASGRPIITTNDNYGCKELLKEDITGYGIKSNDLSSLKNALKKACETNKAKVTEMGKNGREFVDLNFNRKTTIEEYLRIIGSYKK